MQLQSMEELHTFLVNFKPFTEATDINALASKAVKLLRVAPPAQMARRCRARFAHCCTIEAQLVSNAWWVPETPPAPRGLPFSKWQVPPRLAALQRPAKVVVVPLAVASGTLAVWALSGVGGKFDFGNL